jgi:hypothetical protein
LPQELEHYGGVSLSAVVTGDAHFPLTRASLAYVDLPVEADRRLPCLLLGLLLFEMNDTPWVAMVRRTEQHGPPSVLLEVIGVDDGAVADFLAEMARLGEELNAFRGKVLGFQFSRWGQFGIAFHPLPVVERADVILPEADLAAIERHTIEVARQAATLTATGHQLKRGLLLYGPPGTGKTFSVMYLCNQMPGRTTLLLAGVAEGMLGQAVALARRLQPAMVVIEDVDLIAFERTMNPTGANPLLFQLLNEMDGLESDADVIFVLTTNRPERAGPRWRRPKRATRLSKPVMSTSPSKGCSGLPN